MPGFVALAARPPVDLSGFVEDNAVLAFDVRADAALPEDLAAPLPCEPDCAAAGRTLQSALAGLPVGDWQTIRVGLRCLVGGDAGAGNVETIRLFDTAQAARLSLADVRIERDRRPDPGLACVP